MSATVLQFPKKTQRQPRHGAQCTKLEARHRWMMRSKGEWSTEQTDGSVSVPEGGEGEERAYQMARAALRERFGLPELTAGLMRRNIAEGRKLIEKRNRVKQWLASLGVDLTGIKDPEQALFAAFDKLA